jgi:hypothetical protein
VRTAASIALAFALGIGPASAQPVTEMGPARVEEAVKAGLRATSAELKQYELKTAANWTLNFDTPFLRIVQHVAALKKKGIEATAAEVPAAVTSPEIHVYAHARLPEDAKARVPDVDHVVVLRPRGGGTPERIQPLWAQGFIRQVPNELYATRIARSVKAVFPLSVLAAGNSICVTFVDGSQATVPIEASDLAQVR